MADLEKRASTLPKEGLYWFFGNNDDHNVDDDGDKSSSATVPAAKEVPLFDLPHLKELRPRDLVSPREKAGRLWLRREHPHLEAHRTAAQSSAGLDVEGKLHACSALRMARRGREEPGEVRHLLAPPPRGRAQGEHPVDGPDRPSAYDGHWGAQGGHGPARPRPRPLPEHSLSHPLLGRLFLRLRRPRSG